MRITQEGATQGFNAGHLLNLKAILKCPSYLTGNNMSPKTGVAIQLH